jgi:MFS family permease
MSRQGQLLRVRPRTVAQPAVSVAETPQQAARTGLLPQLIRDNPEFRRMWAGLSISQLGDQISLIALPLVAVLALDATPAQMGYLAAAGLAPNLVFALHAGALADRFGRRRKLMIAADLGRAILIGSIPAAYAAGRLSLGLLYVVAFLVGTLSVLFTVSYSTLFISVLPREHYVEGTSLVSGSRAMSFVLGPSIGGWLVQILSAPVALIADGLSFVGSALFLGRISPKEPPTSRRRRGEVAAGARFIVRSPIMRASLLATATVNYFNFVFWALLVLYATRELHVSPGTLGLVLGAASTGGVVGSIVAGRLGRRIGLGPAYIVGCALFTVPLLLVPLAGGPPPLVLGVLLAAEFASGLGVMLLDISVGSIFAGLIPDTLRARVSGAYMLVNYGVRPLGSLTGGALGATIGLRPTLWLATAGAIAGVLWLLPSPVRHIRGVPEEAEDPDDDRAVDEFERACA